MAQNWPRQKSENILARRLKKKNTMDWQHYVGNSGTVVWSCQFWKPLENSPNTCLVRVLITSKVKYIKGWFHWTLNLLSLHFTALTPKSLTPQGIPLPFSHKLPSPYTLEAESWEAKSFPCSFSPQRHSLTSTWHSVKIYERLQRSYDVSRVHLHESETKT